MAAELYVRLWDTRSATFDYPELSDPELKYQPILGRPNTGIAISGGGTVSASLIMGYFYALQEMGVFDNIRYISGVSGGCWGSAPFCYLPEDMDDTTYLGGPKYQPAQLTTAILSQVHKHSLTHAITHADIVAKALEEIPLHPRSAYVRAVGDIFLKPFNIDGTERYYTSDANAVTSIISRNRGLKRENFITLKTNRPFPIMNTSFMSENDVPGPDNYPCDCTPLYVGVKAYHPNAGKNQQNIGGAFVEPFGFNTPSATVDASNQLALVTSGDEKFPLCYPVGTSGEAIEQLIMHCDPIPKLIFPAYSYWNPTDSETKPAVNTYCFGDGGITDDTGVASLLARGVENIVVFLTEPFDTTTTQYKAIGYNQIAALFGQPIFKWRQQGFQPANPNSYMLDSAKFAALQNWVQPATKRADGPVFWKDSYTVQQNDWFGIAGGWTCNILWVFNSKSSQWTNQLPAKVQALLKEPELKDFPYVKVFCQNLGRVICLTPHQANMLGNFGYWMATSAGSQIQTLLGTKVAAMAF